jgi:Ni/Co efflux regulator RcnB
MRMLTSTIFAVALTAMGVVGISGPPLLANEQATVRIQYDRYPDQRPDNYYSGERAYPPPRPDGFYPNPRDRYGERGFPMWRPGDVLPPQLLDYVVEDWDERGLGRPPSGHRWVRVDPQFILVRDRDRMIARVINFN